MDWQDEVKPRSVHSGIGGIDKILKDARRGDLAAVKEHLRRRPDLLDAKSGGHNRSFLWEAVRGNRLDVVRFLLERGADPNIPGRIRAEIPVLLPSLAIARRYERLEIEPLLIEAGARIDLYSACYLGETEAALAMLDARPALLNEEAAHEAFWRVTPLHYAVAGNRIELTRQLVERGAVVRPYTRLLFDIASRLKQGDDMFHLLLESGADESLAEEWY